MEFNNKYQQLVPAVQMSKNLYHLPITAETSGGKAQKEKIKSKKTKPKVDSSKSSETNAADVLKVLQNLEKLNGNQQTKKKKDLFFELEKTHQQINVAALQLIKINQFIAKKTGSTTDNGEGKRMKQIEEKIQTKFNSQNKPKTPTNEKKCRLESAAQLPKVPEKPKKTKNVLPQDIFPRGDHFGIIQNTADNFKRNMCASIYKFKGTLESIAEETEQDEHTFQNVKRRPKSENEKKRYTGKSKYNIAKKGSSSVTVLMQPNPSFEGKQSRFNLIKSLKEKATPKKSVEKIDKISPDAKCVIIHDTPQGKIRLSGVRKDQKQARPHLGNSGKPNVIVERVETVKNSLRIVPALTPPPKKQNLFPILQNA